MTFENIVHEALEETALPLFGDESIRQVFNVIWSVACLHVELYFSFVDSYVFPNVFKF